MRKEPAPRERKKPRGEEPLPPKQDRMAAAYKEMLAESERKHREWVATLHPKQRALMGYDE